jgi:uncharacterized BrkB/YihY/UPF0761 family membrane protein
VFALYYVAFLFMLNLFLHALNEVFLRRVYGEPPRRTFWKTVVLLVLTFLIDVPINAAAALLSVRLT